MENNIKSTREWENIFHAIGQPSLILDAEHNIIAVNKASIKAAGLTEDKIVGKKCYKVFHKDRKEPPPKCPLEKMLESGHIENMEVEIEVLGGMFLVSCTPISDKAESLQRIIHIATDITEQKRAQQALKESEARFRSLYENSTIGMYRTTPEGQILMANPALIKMLRYESFEQLQKRNLEKEGFEFEYGRKKFKQKIEKDGEIHGLDSVWKRKDGSTIYIRESSKAIRDDKGRTVYYEGTVEDITESKLAEKALQESEEKFRSIVENSQQGIIIVDENYRFTYVNEEMSRILGYPPSEILGQDFRKFLDARSRKLVSDRYVRRQRGERIPQRYEFSIVRKNGEVRWVEISSSIIKDSSGQVKTIAQILDITERKQAEEKIKQSEKSYRSVFDNAIDAIYIHDKDGRFIDVNKGAIKMYGYPREFFIGKTPEPLSAPGKNDMKKISQYIRKAFQGEPQQFEFWGIDRKGRVFPKIVRLSKGTYFGREVTFAFAIDISKQKAAENALKQREAHYRLLFDLSPSGIIVENDKGDILEINQAFSSIIGYSIQELLTMNVRDLAPPDARKNIDENISEVLSGSIKIHEEEYIRKDGTRCYAELHETAISLPDGKQGILCITNDITERKEAEEKLKRASSQWSSTFNSIKDAISLIDLNGVIKRCNKAMAEFAGKPLSKIIGSECKDIVHGKSGQPKECPLIRVKKSLKRESMILKTKDKWYDVSIDPEFDEFHQLVGLVHIISDITEQKIIEQSLLESEQKYRQLIQQSNDAIYLLFNRKFEIINKKFERMFGVTLEEVNKSEFDFIQLVAPKSRPMIEERYQKLRKGEKLEPRYEFTAISKNGREIEVETSVSYIPYKGSLASQGIIRDITERKRIEEEIKKSLREKEMLIKEIHHRVKNNLNIVTSLLILQSRLIKDKQAVEAFRESVNRVYSMALVHEKLYQSPSLAEVNFKEFISTMVKKLFTSYNISKRVSLNLDVEEITLPINKAVPLGLMLNEMVTNSLKHAFPRQRKGRLSISLKKVGKNVNQLIVKDDGMGLPSHIDFEKSESLGLELIRLLIAQIDGTMQLDQKKGTKYKIQFRV